MVAPRALVIDRGGPGAENEFLRARPFFEDAKAAAVIRRNAAKLAATDRIEVLASSALALPRSEPFDLILADPPYAVGSGTAVARAVADAGWLARGGWMSVETSRGDIVDPSPFAIDTERVIGRARLTLLRRP